MKTLNLLLMTMLFPSLAAALCQPALSDGRPAPPQGDALFVVLAGASSCPQNVQGLKSLLRTEGLQVRPSMVANRGRHNPNQGSFSFFEQVIGRTSTGLEVKPGEFFFGHFTQASGSSLRLAQEPSPGSLMIELIVWDSRKGLFNFYELISNGRIGVWFYRGDSADVLADNAAVHLQPGRFGARLRCSACHSTGGPILKELAPPHNDWWSAKRPLPLAQAPDREVAETLGTLVDVSDFARAVTVGIVKLENSPAYRRTKAHRSLAEELRPLFCENEINLASDRTPMESGGAFVSVPAAFVVHPKLSTGPLVMPKAFYVSLLGKYRLKFPETNRTDADHGFLVPVRTLADELAVDGLIHRRLLDLEFVADVLAVDLERPLFSSARCSLLQALPRTAAPGWQQAFEKNLERLATPAAQELLKNRRDPSLNLAWHRQTATMLLAQTERALKTPAGADAVFRKLLDTRKAVRDSEISKNPRGQILEPGFRVIFPE